MESGAERQRRFMQRRGQRQNVVIEQGAGVDVGQGQGSVGGLSPEVIRQCFKVCGLTLNLDGSEDHAWCLHTLGRN